MRIEQLAEHGLILSAPTEGYVRSPGLHMSDLYGSLYKELDPKRFDKRDAQGNPLPFDELRMELGSTFEEALEPILRKRVITAERPGEFVTQHAVDCVHTRTPVAIGDAPCSCGAGVIYSPDHFLFNGVFRLGEFKLTWMGIGKGIRDPKFDKWFTQMKVYCYHLGTPYARLYAFFVNGDYSDMSPQFPPPWDIEFTQKEMFEEWMALVRHGRKKGMFDAGKA
jgi:hypothetical protein